jgi:hypothetical protein
MDEPYYLRESRRLKERKVLEKNIETIQKIIASKENKINKLINDISSSKIDLEESLNKLKTLNQNDN